MTIGFSLLLSIFLGGVLGIVFPLISRKVRGELYYTQVRFSSLFIALSALVIYFGMAAVLLRGIA
jgi:hypothetical protein